MTKDWIAIGSIGSTAWLAISISASVSWFLVAVGAVLIFLCSFFGWVTG